MEKSAQGQKQQLVKLQWNYGIDSIQFNASRDCATNTAIINYAYQLKNVGE